MFLLTELPLFILQNVDWEKIKEQLSRNEVEGTGRGLLWSIIYEFDPTAENHKPFSLVTAVSRLTTGHVVSE
jgi:hypothetical protein